MTPEEAVRAYFAAYSEGHPEQFDEIVAPDYVDYGHTPPGRGPQGARDDYENAVRFAGGVLVYDIDALVARDDMVAAAWLTGADFRTSPEPDRLAPGRFQGLANSPAAWA